MSKVIGIDLGTTNSVVAVMEGGEPPRHPEPGGRSDDAVRGRVHEDRRASRRPGRQAPGGDEPREHRVLDQAVHGPEVRARSPKSRRWCPTRWSKPRTATPGCRCRGKVFSPPEISAMILQKMKDAAEQHLGEKVHEGRDHGAGLLQRLPAPGDQGRGPDRGPRGAAHRERADGGRPGLRPGQEEGRDDRGVRLRRRHVRHLGPRGRRGRRRGEGHQRRHPPRRRQPRPAGDRLDRRRVPAGAGHRPVEGQDGAAAPEGGGGEGQVRAVARRWRRRSTCPSSRRTPRAEAPVAEADARRSWSSSSEDLLERTMGPVGSA